MTPDALFNIANPLAMAGWIVLLASPLSPVWSDRIAALVIPGLFSIAYTGLVLAFFGGAEGGFDSLDNVMSLFQQPEIVLAGWIHFLAFDLFVGAWIARTARAEGIAFWLVIPCFVLTFMFGPAGFLAFTALRAMRAGRLAGKEA